MAFGDLIVTRNVNNDEPYYPVSFFRSSLGTGTWRDLPRSLSTNNWCVGMVQGVVVDPEAEWVPDKVRRIRQPGRILVMFYGPAYNKVMHPLPCAFTFLGIPVRSTVQSALFARLYRKRRRLLSVPFAVGT